MAFVAMLRLKLLRISGFVFYSFVLLCSLCVPLFNGYSTVPEPFSMVSWLVDVLQAKYDTTTVWIATIASSFMERCEEAR